MFHRSAMLAPNTTRLRFAIDPDTGVEAVIIPPVPTVVPPVDLGFPADTPIANMTDKEQAAYFKHYSRKHESEKDALKLQLADYPAIKAKADAADVLAAANATDAEKALAAATEAGRAESRNTYLADAVSGELRAQTGKTAVELADALALIDVTKLTTAEGALDLVKITAFAKTLGGTAATAIPVDPTDPVKDVFDRSGTPPVAGGASIKDTVAARVKELSTSK